MIRAAETIPQASAARPPGEAQAETAAGRRPNWIRLAAWLLIALFYSAGASSLGGAWEVLLNWLGLLLAAALGGWFVGSRATGLPFSAPAVTTPASLNGRADQTGPPSVSPPVPQGDGLSWEDLLRRWDEEGRLMQLRLADCFYMPPSSAGDMHLVLLGMARGLKEKERLNVGPIQTLEEAERYLHALNSIPPGAQPKPICVLPVGLIARLGKARPNLPEWHEAVARAGFRWLGEGELVPLGEGLYYLPLVAEFQIRPEPIRSVDLRPQERRKGLYLGADTNGAPVFLPWPWHVVVAGRSGAGKTNTLRHLLVEAVLASRWMGMPLVAVSITAKEDGMSGLLRVGKGRPVWIPLPKERARALACRLDPARRSRRMRILVVDEAQELLFGKEGQGLLQAVVRAISMGRANRLAVFLGTSNARADYLPPAVTQHAKWLIHPTDGNEASLLLRRAAVDWDGRLPAETGEAIYLGLDRRAVRIRVPLDSFREVVQCAS